MTATRRVVSILLFVLFAAGAGGTSAAPIVDWDVDDLLDGTFKYSYTVTNPDGSGQAIFDFSLPSFAGEILSIGSPVGWTDISGLGFINWYSTFPDNGGPPPDILPGQTLTGFFFTSAFGPGDIPYSTVSTVEGDPFNVLPPVEGVTVGPVAAAPVPEPGTMLLVGTGLFGAWHARRRRQRA